MQPFPIEERDLSSFFLIYIFIHLSFVVRVELQLKAGLEVLENYIAASSSLLQSQYSSPSMTLVHPCVCFQAFFLLIFPFT